MESGGNHEPLLKLLRLRLLNQASGEPVPLVKVGQSALEDLLSVHPQNPVFEVGRWWLKQVQVKSFRRLSVLSFYQLTEIAIVLNTKHK